MIESPASPWRARLTRLRALAWKALPFVGGMIAAFAAVAIYSALNPAPTPLSLDQVDDAVANHMASATPPPSYSSMVYQVIRPSLILIQSDFPPERGEESHGLGTGVVVSTEGDILTSLHVVDQAISITVFFADGTESSAYIVGAQPEIDIAVIRADSPPDELFPATLGNPNAMRVGDEVYAVGNPFGLYGSMSSGVISGFDRSFRNPETDIQMQGLIQIDAAVNPGNSGGPLLNRAGQVIGIVAAIFNPTEDEVFIGIGFAVPITVAGGAAGAPPQ